jgi:uncharacterized protein (TIGR03435 family)
MRDKLELLIIAASTCCYAFGQDRLPSHFEIVSIKPSMEINTNKGIRYSPDGGFRAANYSLKDLIRLGWDVRAFQITGGPDWLDAERYDVQTKPDVPFNPLSGQGDGRLREMVRSMLQDRFRLQLHQQKKEMSVYNLVLTQKVLKLKRTGDARDATTLMRDRKGYMWAKKFDMELLARYLGGEFGLPVIDRTGLTGVYDFELVWNPEDGKLLTDVDAPPSLVSAIREQLGLELKRGRGEVEMVVVDYAEKASAN